MSAQFNEEPVILIVDDEEINAIILKEAVKSLGAVYSAHSGHQALAQAKKLQPDVVLLDIEMPDIDGFEVCKRIKQDPDLDNTAVIFVTGHSNLENELKALSYGGIGFISKPVIREVAYAHVKIHLDLKRKQTQLSLASATLKNIIHNLPAFVAYWDNELNNIFCNDIEGSWFDIPAAILKGKNLLDLIDKENAYLSAEATDTLKKAVIAAQQGTATEFNISLSDDSVFVTGALVPTKVEGDLKGVVMLLNDITSISLLQKDLHQEKEFLNIILNSIGDAVIATDTKGLVTFMNPIAEAITGRARSDSMGMPVERVMPIFDSSGQYELINPIYYALKEKRTVCMALDSQLKNADKDFIEVEDSAAPVFDEEGNLHGGIIVFHDVSETRAMALKMSYLANHDSLTNLPNRMLLQDRAEQALAKAKRKSEKVAMFVIDIDNFKLVNDSVGHSVGDSVIQTISTLLLTLTREIDTVSRQGGDEFIVLMPEVSKLEQIIAFAQSVLKMFKNPIYVENTRFNLTCSIGISIYPDDSTDRDSLYQHADTAMYQAKQLGRSRWHFFSDEIEASMLAMYRLEQYLRVAHEAGNFELYYQSKVDTRKDSIVGVEALLRLRDEDGNPISPAEFIPVAEETGFIIPIGKKVIAQACSDVMRWSEMGYSVPVSINISTVQFSDPNFFNYLKDFIIDNNVDPELIELEITEGVLAKDTTYIEFVLMQLKELGIKVSIDDFGTGYSSLSYLKQFPIDVLKIDQSFIKDMLCNSSNEAIVDAVISLAKSLNLDLVAEGVETQKHVEALSLKECHIVQGYRYCKPMPFEEMCKHLESNTNK